MRESPASPDLLHRAEQGEVAAQFELGVAYAFAARPDYAAAKRWWTPAAIAGYAAAQLNLGALYAEGKGGDRSDTLAARFYQKAADQNYAPALYALGMFHQVGRGGFSQNLSTAFALFSQAAELGSREALNALGQCYYYGSGTTRNTQKAEKCFWDAAVLGSPAALKNVGLVMGEAMRQAAQYCHLHHEVSQLAPRPTASTPRAAPSP